MGLADRITVDPKILGGKPVIRGTRISTELVLELLDAGWTHDQIPASYPHWSRTTSPRFWLTVGFLVKMRRGSPNVAGLSHYGDYAPAGGLLPPELVFIRSGLRPR